MNCASDLPVFKKRQRRPIKRSMPSLSRSLSMAYPPTKLRRARWRFGNSSRTKSPRPELTTASIFPNACGGARNEQRTPPILPPDQTDVVADIEGAIAAGQKRLLLVAPTGSGKTVVFCEIIKRYVEQHRSVLALAHRREIIQQTSAKLSANGVRHGIIQAGIDPRPMASVQVASV